MNLDDEPRCHCSYYINVQFKNGYVTNNDKTLRVTYVETTSAKLAWHFINLKLTLTWFLDNCERRILKWLLFDHKFSLASSFCHNIRSETKFNHTADMGKQDSKLKPKEQTSTNWPKNDRTFSSNREINCHQLRCLENPKNDWVCLCSSFEVGFYIPLSYHWAVAARSNSIRVF